MSESQRESLRSIEEIAATHRMKLQFDGSKFYSLVNEVGGNTVIKFSSMMAELPAGASTLGPAHLHMLIDILLQVCKFQQG